MKEVQIRRKERVSYLPARVVAESRRKLGSIFVSRSPLKGLTEEDEKKYLPRVLGISPNSPTFEEMARKYWAEFTIDVPADGVVLNITVNGDGEPLNLDDWIKYQWAKKHRFVARSKEQMTKDPKKSFYIYDPDTETTKTNIKVKNRRAAYKEFIRIAEDENAVIRTLRVLGTAHPESLTSEQKENLLASKLDEDPEKFYSVVTDKKLEVRDLISRLMEHDVLRTVGNTYFYMDKDIGDGMEEAITFIQSKRNSTLVNEMKAKLREFSNESHIEIEED